MAAISVVSNAVSVVGLADVVFRLSIALTDLYFRCHGAKKNVPRLIKDLKNLTGIVVQVQAFADEYTRSLYVLEDSQTLLPQLEAILRSCERDLQELELVAKRVNGTPNDGWLKQLGNSLSWGLDDQKVLRSCQNLERVVGTLNTALSLTGR
jgi:hypothetical protein